jgi:uncharacterized membrane protein YphA (DoxX/SURF4 family)
MVYFHGLVSFNVLEYCGYHKRKYLLFIDLNFAMALNKLNIRNIILLLIRIWLGYRMFTASYSSVTGILFHPKERIFFENWFGKELHFPLPLTMAFLAKGSELAGSIFVFFGLFTRPAAALISFTMLVATLTAHLGENWNIDGGFTVSYFLFALVLITEGGGKYSLDELLIRKKHRNKMILGN